MANLIGPRTLRSTPLGTALSAVIGLTMSCGSSKAPPQLDTQADGQSGSEYRPPASASYAPCPCLGGGLWLRAHVLEGSADRVRLQLDERLGGSAQGEEEALQPGDEFGGGYQPTPICGGGTCLQVEVGDEVLARFSPTIPRLPDCQARQDCLPSCSTNNGRSDTPSAYSPECFEQCRLETADQCEVAGPIVPSEGSVGLALWEDSVLFAATATEELRVPVSQLPLLWTTELVGCEERLGNAYELVDYPADTRAPETNICE